MLTAMTSPSTIALSAFNSFMIVSTISGRDAVTSERRRLKILTLSPSSCIWTRAPSGLNSKHVLPSCSERASSTLATGSANIGLMGWKSVTLSFSSSETPYSMATFATEPRSLTNRSALLTRFEGTLEAEAIASSISPSRKPSRISKMKFLTMYFASRGVARLRRDSMICLFFILLPNPTDSATASKYL